jgi:hypothetical protein
MKKNKWSEKEIKLLNQNYNEGATFCSKLLNRTPTSVRGMAQRLGIYCNKIHVSNLNEELVKLAAIKSDTKKHMLINLGLKPHGRNYTKLDKLITKYQVNTSHFLTSSEIAKKYVPTNNKYSLDDILIMNSSYNRGGLKKKLYDSKIKERKCELCGQGEIWQGKKISLILDHINGINNDNRLINLRIVCPNCNATLDTHCGKHMRKKRYKKYENKNKYFEDLRETKYNKIHKQRISLVKKLDLSKTIDFKKYGWVKKLSIILKIKEQKINKWIKKYMPEFYDEKCYKRTVKNTSA